MTLYAYRCANCGPFDLPRSMGKAVPEEPCVRCAAPASRIFTPPLLARTPRALARALHAQESSAHEPRIVKQPPPAAPRRTPPADPRQARLPRP
jgi:putative FmdB family regulatory protein